MQQTTGRIILSFTLFILIVGMALWIKSTYIPRKLRTPENLLLRKIDTLNTTVYFLGSSRVGNGIDGISLEQHLHTDINILSFSGATFLCNTIMATELASQKGRKVLLIELSPVAPNVTNEWLTFMYINGINPVNRINKIAQNDNLWRYRNFYISLYNDVLVQHFNLGDDKKWLLTNDRKPIWFFAPWQGGSMQSTTTFLNPGELSIPLKKLDADTSHLMQMIRIIESATKGKDCQVLYFAPVNIRNPLERQMVRAVWQKLPLHQRINYPDSVLLRLTKASNLYDQIHLNAAGAAAFTEFWKPALDSLLRTKVQPSPLGSY